MAKKNTQANQKKDIFAKNTQTKTEKETPVDLEVLRQEVADSIGVDISLLADKSENELRQMLADNAESTEDRESSEGGEDTKNEETNESEVTDEEENPEDEENSDSEPETPAPEVEEKKAKEKEKEVELPVSTDSVRLLTSVLYEGIIYEVGTELADNVKLAKFFVEKGLAEFI